MLKRTIPSAGLMVMPLTGHTSNLEDPSAFNREGMLTTTGAGLPDAGM